MRSLQNRNSLTAMLCCALLTAVGVVLKIFVTFNITLGAVIINRLGVHLLVIYLAAILFGPAYGAITGALVDFLSSVLAPVGAYNPCYTLTLALAGLLIWLFYQKVFGRVPRIFWRVMLTVAAVQILFIWPVNTLWTVIFYGAQKGFWGLLLSRASSLLFYVPVFSLTLAVLVPILEKELRKLSVRRAG